MLEEKINENHCLMCPNTDIDELDYWIECVNMCGDDLDVNTLEDLIDNAPDVAKFTTDYYYMLGWLDVLYINSPN